MVAGAILLGRHATGLAAAEGSAPAEASASDSANPYSVIVERNVFRLSPPPPPPSISNGPPPDLPVVNLSGFVRTGGETKVLLAVKVKTGNSASPEDTSYLTMSEGDKDGVVELVKIYPDQEMVDIKNSGTPMTLSMKENGFQNAPAAPAPGARGAGPGIRQIGMPANGVQPGVPNLGAVQPVQGQIAGEGNTLVTGSSTFNRGGFNNPNAFGGGTVASPGVQPQQTAYQTGGYNARTGGGVITGSGYVPPPAQAPLTIPIGQTGGLSHLTQPNSTPAATEAAPNVEMPPMPGVQ
jgi:hypothetical protein